MTAGAFLDREVELGQLRTLVARLRAGSPPWVAIIGPRKVGKTSLILELARTCEPDGPAFVLLDAERERPLSLELFRTYAVRAADALLGRDGPTALEVALRTGGDYIGALYATGLISELSADTVQVLRALGDRQMDPAFARLCVELPELLARGLGRKVVIAFDEFQEITTLGGTHKLDPLPLLRSVWQRHEHVAYIVSGSSRSMLEDMVTQEHSPFFQHFSLMYLDAFSLDDAVRLLVAGAEPDCSIPPELARLAAQAVGSHPFYVQLLGEELMRLGPRLDESSLKVALQSLLFSRAGRLALYFQNIFDRAVGRSSMLAAVLSCVAEEPGRLADLSRRLRLRTGDVSRYLERLGDLVERDAEQHWHIADPTLALWLRWRRPGGTVVPMSVLGDDAEKEVAAHLARLGFELVYQSRGSRGAFDLLATRGPTQLGVQVKRRRLPLRFSRAAWDRMEEDAQAFGWTWVVAAVVPDGGVVFLDPAEARRGREVRIGLDAAIEHVLAWVRARSGP